MNFFESIRISLRSIRVNKMLSFLTMLGIIIGVCSVITMVAISQGATSSVTNQIQSLGSNLLIVAPGQAVQGNVKMGAGTKDTLTLNDVNVLKKVSTVQGVAPDTTKSATVTYGDTSYSTTIEGTNPDFITVRNRQMQQGRFFTDPEMNANANVAVLGSDVVTNLFGNPNASVVGRTVNINSIPFTVIGVLQSQGSSASTNNDDRIIIPITTGIDRIFGSASVRNIYVSAASADQLSQAQLDVEMALRSSHNLMPSDAEDFQITNQSDVLNTAQGVTSVMTTLLAGTAAISLLVGGIGIMNIMLVSVTERTREIGIRKAIGATRGRILAQFLIEAMVLSVSGGIIGILLGFVGSKALTQFANLATTIQLSPIVYSFIFSLLVGVVFGVYPARKASRLNPIDALRYEYYRRVLK
jgi:putative ABC transport system permease protein